MSNNSTHMRGDEILLMAEIKAAAAMREAIAAHREHQERFQSTIPLAHYITRICDRAQNEDDAA
ncbi:hypothetical protein [Thalassospira xiamenensis]|mgnify:CR=1 FL=1|jgi:hypothetical protein|uniref:hypothetical protein n=1 Tax=Thalassospira xiamenensis TaxID=220697 RepID=UPI000E809664|nr:hypothetical protein [Thalassospira xiamenensis]HBN47619.1 hypothetical protein [Thalassospira sp.]|tara:strand:+ start:2564 stop:2755 length:192 start_codon:yes stop_codon:yes gene_type:complete